MAQDPLHSYHELPVSEVVDETAEARSFAFEIPSDLEELFRYRAGQFLTFRVPWQNMELQRCYSLCSSPAWNEVPRVTVKRIADGRVSNWLNDHVKVGDGLRVLPPEGRFVLHDSERPLLFFAGGSGITPVLSLIKTALVSSRRRLKLVYANSDRESVIFREELGELAQQHADRFELRHHLDCDRGFLDVAGARAQIAGWEHADPYVCGPAEFMDIVEDALEASGIEHGRIAIERFVSPTDPDRAPQPTAAPALATASEVPERIVIKLEGTTHELPYQAGRTLLETAKDAGLVPPFACEEGYCSTCMARLKRGTVEMRVNDALTDRDLADGWILTCQGVPTSAECQIDWDEM